MSYNPRAKVYYGNYNEEESGTSRLVPAPQISVNQEMLYANDIIIGYNYLVTLNGYATSVDFAQNLIGTGINDTLSSLKRVKSIFNKNGGTLLVTDGSGQPVLKAIGGIIRNINFEESDNRWVNYIPYSIEIEFGEINFNGCDESGIVQCGQIVSGIQESPELVDIKKYKIKSFSDNWSFDLQEQIYNGYQHFRNEHFNITYQVQAIGKHYFKDNKLLPAWEQAKNFVQHRIRTQVERLINNALRRNDNSCAPDSTISTLFRSAPPGIFEGLNAADYDLYNEVVGCETSESDGTFSANYSAILKRKNSSDNNLYDPNSLHTFSVSRDVQDDGKAKTVNLSVEGNIQGLIAGGLIKSPNVIELPVSGRIYISLDPTITKHSNALLAYNKIATKNSLKSNFQSFLGITNQAVLASGECIEPSGLPPPANHSVSHDYINGTINYKSEYNTDRACNQLSNNRTITVSIEDSVPVVAEFVIPGRSAGPIIQEIIPASQKKITLNIEGSVTPKCCNTDPSYIVGDICENGVPLPTGINIPELTGHKLISDQYTSNPIDGSYSITRSYICCDN